MNENFSAHYLLMQLQCGHEEVIDILYPRYAKDFYTYARHQGFTHEDAEDIVHTTFYKILSSIAYYDVIAGAGAGWMWRICRNLIIDMKRRKSTVNYLRRR